MIRILALLALLTCLSSCKEKTTSTKASSDRHPLTDTLSPLVPDTITEPGYRLSCNLLPSIFTQGKVTIYFNEISESEFERMNREDYYKPIYYPNSDSIEGILQGRYPEIFSKKDGAYFFKAENGEGPIKVWNNLVQEKSYTRYEFKGSYEQYIFILQEFYEGSQYVLINTQTGESYSLAGTPRFMNDDWIFGIGGYGTADISILHPKNKKSAFVVFDYLDVIESYTFVNSISLKLRCPWNGETYPVKYLRITLGR